MWGSLVKGISKLFKGNALNNVLNGTMIAQAASSMFSKFDPMVKVNVSDKAGSALSMKYAEKVPLSEVPANQIDNIDTENMSKKERKAFNVHKEKFNVHGSSESAAQQKTNGGESNKSNGKSSKGQTPSAKPKRFMGKASGVIGTASSVLMGAYYAVEAVKGWFNGGKEAVTQTIAEATDNTNNMPKQNEKTNMTLTAKRTEEKEPPLPDLSGLTVTEVNSVGAPKGPRTESKIELA